MRHVIVIGSGVAGAAAALGASMAGATVTLVRGGAGASVLAGGALDATPWEERGPGAAPTRLDETARAVLDALGGYEVGAASALLACTTGLVREAEGRDRALLDLAALGGGTVLVPAVLREGGAPWDAPHLARAWSSSPLATAAGVGFAAVDADLLALSEERAFHDEDLATRHDDPTRLAWLAARLREAAARHAHASVGFLLPPWLGAGEERATTLSAVLGVPCGEALVGLGGPSGARFEQARDRALRRFAVAPLEGMVTAVTPTHADAARRWSVSVRANDGDELEPLSGDSVVLALGGVLGGGLRYTPAGAYEGRALPDTPRPLLALACTAPVTLGARGRPLDDPSSLFGGAPEAHSWPFVSAPLVDHAGVLVRDDGQALGAPPGLYAAGEIAAGRPHTWLAALAAGARAGTLAARG